MNQGAPRWPAGLDAAADALLIVFAGWTLVYQLGLLTQLSLHPLGLPLLVAVILVPLIAGLRAVRSPDEGVARRSLDGETAAPSEGSVGVELVPLLLGTVLPVVLLLVLLALRERVGIWPAALLALVVAGREMLRRLRDDPVAPPEVAPGRSVPDRLGPGTSAHLVAVGFCLLLAGLGSFLSHPDADDAYYVNRASWVAETGTAARNDTMFGPDVLPTTVGTNLPTPSIEAAEGVLAHALGLSAPTVCYVVAVPLLGFLAGWTTWRLIRAWAPRRHLLVLVVGAIFLLASGDGIAGNYAVTRIWQGKVIAYVIVIPLVWLLLSRLLSPTPARARRRVYALLAAAGVAFVGLTTTSALLTPLIAGIALVASLLLRSRHLAVGAVCFGIGPALNVAAQLLSGPGAIGGEVNVVPPWQTTFFGIFGANLAMITLSFVALALAARSPGRGNGCLLGCAAVVTLATFLPGVYEAVGAVTGASAITWRLSIGLPIWVLVGLLAANSLPVRTGPPARVLAAFPAFAVALVSVLGGTWWWQRPGTEVSAPGWKVAPQALADVRAIEREPVPPGRWLLPPEQMQIVAISRADVFSVVPRGLYLSALHTPGSDLAQRRSLLALVSAEQVPVARVRSALSGLGVSLACVPAGDSRAKAVLRRAVRAELTDIGEMACHVGVVGSA